MIRGDHQVEGFNYNETFTSVSELTIIRIFLSVVVDKRLGITSDGCEQCLSAIRLGRRSVHEYASHIQIQWF